MSKTFEDFIKENCDKCEKAKECNKTIIQTQNRNRVRGGIDMKYYLTKEEVLKKQIKKSYPECENCPFWEKRKTSNEIYCFYRSKNECLIKNK